MFDVVRNRYRFCWFSAESGRSARTSAAQAAALEQLRGAGSTAAMRQVGPQPVLLEVVGDRHELKFWPGGSLANAPLPSDVLDGQNGLGGVGPSGL